MKITPQKKKTVKEVAPKPTKSFSGVKVGTKIRILRAEGRKDYTGKEGTVLEINNGELKGTWGELELLPHWDIVEIVK